VKIFTSIFFLLATTSLCAQQWEDSFDVAVQKAHENDKPIILVFAGSDWCAPCIKLDQNIWQSSEFKDYASENYILYKADFPKKESNRLSVDKASQNSRLAEKYNKNGHFPLVLVLNKNKQVLGTAGYSKVTPKAYLNLLNSYIN